MHFHTETLHFSVTTVLPIHYLCVNAFTVKWLFNDRTDKYFHFLSPQQHEAAAAIPSATSRWSIDCQNLISTVADRIPLVYHFNSVINIPKMRTWICSCAKLALSLIKSGHNEQQSGTQNWLFILIMIKCCHLVAIYWQWTVGTCNTTLCSSGRTRMLNSPLSWNILWIKKVSGQKEKNT